MLDSKIVGGLVVDGSGMEPYRADIRCEGRKIVEVSRAGIEMRPSRRSTRPAAFVTRFRRHPHHYDVRSLDRCSSLRACTGDDGRLRQLRGRLRPVRRVARPSSSS